MCQFSSVQSLSHVQLFATPCSMQHTRPPCPSPNPRVHPNSCPSSWWCHPAISSSVIYRGPAPAGSRGTLRMDSVGEERERERMTQGDQPSVSEARHFIFRGSFYTLSCTLSKVKNAESAQQSFSINFYRYQVSSCIPFHKQGSYFLYIIFWPRGLFTFYDPFLIKVAQLKHLLFLEMFFLKFLSLHYP